MKRPPRIIPLDFHEPMHYSGGFGFSFFFFSSSGRFFSCTAGLGGGGGVTVLSAGGLGGCGGRGAGSGVFTCGRAGGGGGVEISWRSGGTGRPGGGFIGAPGRGPGEGRLAGLPFAGAAGLPAGANLIIGRAAGELAGLKVCTSRRARGCPGCAARACCC